MPALPAEEPYSPTQRIPLGQRLLPANPGLILNLDSGTLGDVFSEASTSKTPLRKSGCTVTSPAAEDTTTSESLGSKQERAELQLRTQSPRHTLPNLEDSASLGCCHYSRG